MEKKIEKIENDNGSYTTIKTIETSKADGFIHEADISDVGIDNYGKYHKGRSKRVIFTTNDPRVTRPFAYGISGIFFIIGIIMLLLHDWFFGIIFTATSIFVFFKSKKDIDTIAESLKKQEHAITINSSTDMKK